MEIVKKNLIYRDIDYHFFTKPTDTNDYYCLHKKFLEESLRKRPNFFDFLIN